MNISFPGTVASCTILGLVSPLTQKQMETCQFTFSFTLYSRDRTRRSDLVNRADLRWCRLPRSIPPVASGGISVGSASEEKPGGEVEGPEIDLHQGECERAGRFTFTDHTEDDHTNFQQKRQKLPAWCKRLEHSAARELRVEAPYWTRSRSTWIRRWRRIVILTLPPKKDKKD